MSSPERGWEGVVSHTRAVMRVPRWKQKKKTEKRTITRRTARWATSKLSRGRIQPYIGVDTVPRSRQCAIQRAPRSYLRVEERREKKKKENATACINYASRIMNLGTKTREFSRFCSRRFSPRGRGGGGEFARAARSRLRNRSLFEQKKNLFRFLQGFALRWTRERGSRANSCEKKYAANLSSVRIFNSCRRLYRLYAWYTDCRGSWQNHLLFYGFLESKAIFPQRNRIYVYDLYAKGGFRSEASCTSTHAWEIQDANPRRKCIDWR